MTIAINGRVLESYVVAYIVGDRIVAPVDPLFERLADRAWYERGELIVERGSRRVRIALAARPQRLDATYVPAGAVLRALGIWYAYDARTRRLFVRLPRGEVVSPSPFDPAAPSAAPAPVFTPEELPTPRPVWTGTPMPRRTPLLIPPPRLE